MENKVFELASNYIKQYNATNRVYAEINCKLECINDTYMKETLYRQFIEYGGTLKTLAMVIDDLRGVLKGIAVIEYKMLNKRFVFNDKRHNITYSEYSIKAVAKDK